MAWMDLEGRPEGFSQAVDFGDFAIQSRRRAIGRAQWPGRAKVHANKKTVKY
jgi:hypothetical protein